jgi:hypothetical protein
MMKMNFFTLKGSSEWEQKTKEQGFLSGRKEQAQG